MLFRLSSKLSLILFLFHSHGYAERELSEREILARCYAQLTGTRLSVRDSLWRDLDKSSALELCGKLLDSVALNNDGLLLDQGNRVQRQILKQFNDIHKNWFPQHLSFLNTFPDTYYGTVDIHDADEPALFITRALFSQSAVAYRSVLSGTSSLRAIRDSASLRPEARGATGTLRPSRIYFGDTDQQQPAGIIDQSAVAVQSENTYFAVPSSLISVGELIGIGLHTDVSSSPLFWTNNFTGTATMSDSTLVSMRPFHRGFGGGALGSTPFLLTNFGHGFDFKGDGALNVPRKVMFTALNSFLCRGGPFLRTDDVGSYLADATDTNAAPFRKSVSCLRCHAAMDQAAATMRNLRLGSTVNNIQFGVSRVPAMVLTSTVDKPAIETWPTSADPDYYRRPPTGKFLFRSVNGKLISWPLNSIDELGSAMAETDDYYACAASRYFKYFTGINVNLFDSGDASNQALIDKMGAKETEFHDYVMQLGKDLRQTQSLRNLIKKILRSKYYKLAQFGR